MEKASLFLKEIIDLLSQVIWPEKKDLIRLTVVVVLVSLVVSGLLSGFDFILTKLMGWLTLR